MAIRLSTASRNAAADAVVGLIDGGSGAGTLKIYAGSAPATPDDTPAGTLLATVTLEDPAFGAAASGVASMEVPGTVTASGTGTAGCFLIEDSTGANVFDGTVTASGGGGDLVVASTAFATGIDVSILSFTYTQPAS